MGKNSLHDNGYNGTTPNSPNVSDKTNVAVMDILSDNEILLLAENIEETYGLKAASQVITGIDEKILKQELLLRGEPELNPENLVKEITENGDRHGLVCYLLNTAFKTYELNETPSSINLDVSDILHKDFINTVNIFSTEYSHISCSNIIFEILESEELPNNKDKRKLFFDNLRILKSKGFKIAIDDVGGRDKEGNLLYSNRDRIDEFIKEGVLDIVKLDMELVRELYLLSKGKKIPLEKVRKTYKIPNDIEDVNVIKFVGNYHSNLEGIEIVGEGIEKEFWKTVDGKRKMYADGIDYKDFMKFINQYLGVTHFQGYALGKPQDPKNIKKSLH